MQNEKNGLIEHNYVKILYVMESDLNFLDAMQHYKMSENLSTLTHYSHH